MTFSPNLKLDGRTILIGKGADAARVEVTVPNAEVKIQPEEIHADVRTPHLLVTLRIDLTEPVKQATITVTIRPAE